MMVLTDGIIEKMKGRNPRLFLPTSFYICSMFQWHRKNGRKAGFIISISTGVIKRFSYGFCLRLSCVCLRPSKNWKKRRRGEQETRILIFNVKGTINVFPSLLPKCITSASDILSIWANRVWSIVWEENNSRKWKCFKQRNETKSKHERPHMERNDFRVF